MNRHGNRSRPSWLLVNVVTAPDPIQYPALPLQRLANLSPTGRLHCHFRSRFWLPGFRTANLIVPRPPTPANGKRRDTEWARGDIRHFPPSFVSIPSSGLLAGESHRI